MSLYDKVLEQLNVITMDWYKANGYYTSEHRGMNARLKEFLVEQLEVVKVDPTAPLLRAFNSEFKDIFPEAIETAFEGDVRYANSSLVDPAQMFKTNPQYGTLVVEMGVMECGTQKTTSTHREYESFPIAHYNNDLIAEIISIELEGK